MSLCHRRTGVPVQSALLWCPRRGGLPRTGCQVVQVPCPSVTPAPLSTRGRQSRGVSHVDCTCPWGFSLAAGERRGRARSQASGRQRAGFSRAPAVQGERAPFAHPGFRLGAGERCDGAGQPRVGRGRGSSDTLAREWDEAMTMHAGRPVRRAGGARSHHALRFPEAVGQ